MEKDQLFNFRQPLVTAAGIILGFVLNFATELVKRENKSDLIALLILLFTLSGITLLIVSSYRILSNNYDRDNARKYYRVTLNYFLAGVIFSFMGGLIKMIHTLFLS
jgi:vacuolar-type H+-ATPase subunit I/STV1